MLFTENAEGYRRRFLERSPRLFEPANHVRLEAMRLVAIGDIEHLESFDVQSSDVLSQVLSVSPYHIPRDKRGRNSQMPSPASVERNMHFSKSQ